jgi:hypothetical protein
MGLLPAGGIDGSLRGGAAISCGSMRSAAGASSFPGFALSSTGSATFIMENLRKGAVPKPGSTLRLSVVEAGHGIGSASFITYVIKHAIYFFTIVIKQNSALFALAVNGRIQMARPREFDEDTVLEAATQRLWNNGRL